jgi:hypothetical protein
LIALGLEEDGSLLILSPRAQSPLLLIVIIALSTKESILQEKMAFKTKLL